MDIFERQQHIQNLKNARDSFLKNHAVYYEISNLFSNLIEKLEKNIDNDLVFFKNNSQQLVNKLKSQDLILRKNFVEMNKFNEFDLSLLSGLLQSKISNNIPVLELFPGSGQFLPYAVAAEPLYIADRFIQICEDASKTLNNEFYQTRRLRKYEVKNDISEGLPINSFGLIYCFNEFFMANENYILEIANQIYKLLFKGGNFIFNFMPNDQLWAQKLSFENSFSLIDYKNLISELTIMGYTITNYEIRQLKSSYIIAKKSGEFEYRYKKGGGTAEIIDL